MSNVNINKNVWPEFHQVAIHVEPEMHEVAVKLLGITGNDEWSHDHATLVGEAWNGVEMVHMASEAAMSFNYQMLNGRELEIVSYIGGSHHDLSGVRATNPNGFISHMSTMCADAEEEASNFIAQVSEDADIALRVVHRFDTYNHVNPHVAGKKRFREVVVGTREVAGFDLKFIQRLYEGPWEYPHV